LNIILILHLSYLFLELQNNTKFVLETLSDNLFTTNHFNIQANSLFKVEISLSKFTSLCQTHHSMYPSIFNRFPVIQIQPLSSKVRHFSTCFCTFWPPWYTPWTIAVYVTWMERGFNAGQTHSHIYPSIFNRLRAIARYWSEIATFSYPPCI